MLRGKGGAAGDRDTAGRDVPTAFNEVDLVRRPTLQFRSIRLAIQLPAWDLIM